jgi:hypothetical protein
VALSKAQLIEGFNQLLITCEDQTAAELQLAFAPKLPRQEDTRQPD